MRRESEIAMEHAFAPSDVGKSIDRRLYPTHDEIPNWPTVCTSPVAGKKVTRWKTGSARRTGTRAPLRIIGKQRENTGRIEMASIKRKDNL